jgi:5-hydroxyisourate hydrolase
MGISTHILDTALGRPAAEIPVSLAIRKNEDWTTLNEAITDADGRCKHLLPSAESVRVGVYRVHFDTSVYYRTHQLKGLYPYVEVVFAITDTEQHYHIPLLLTANGYTTYRGS